MSATFFALLGQRLGLEQSEIGLARPGTAADLGAILVAEDADELRLFTAEGIGAVGDLGGFECEILDRLVRSAEVLQDEFVAGGEVVAFGVEVKAQLISDLRCQGVDLGAIDELPSRRIRLV